MLRTISGHTTNKSISTKDNINRVGDSKMIVKADIIDKKSEMGYFILRTRFAFAELRQAFSKTLILYYYDPKCHI